MKPHIAPPPIRGHASVAADEVITLDELSARLGLGTAAIRTARGKGLRVRRIGRRKFVVGRDLIAYLEAQP